ncbi:hypothetical protein D6D10_00791 [Aureobasidium pullulans]|uniref:Major facilitator superfamily (MFS) profile domain-containing protein n=1 Tax=Aureobasidium pullulans TaxID=5580 RepID=A0A4S9F901_AURPU|nr:hypothetical protein D6D10_00791 [Aureobasidium pullulans]
MQRMSTTTTRTTLEMQEQPRRRSVVPGADIQAPIPATISAGSSYFPDLEGKRVLWSDLPDISSFPSTPAGAQTPAGASTPGWLTPGNATPGWQTPAGASTPGWATPKSTQARPLLSEDAYPDIGTMYSWRGVMILLITCGSQLMDNIFMTAVNLSLPAVQAEFNVSSGDLQWLLSAYTLTFGGFLLFSGVLADRYGRRQVFSIGMGVLSVWTLANGFGNSFIQLAIFRALQGIGAAMTVPSSIGIISSHFVASERIVALTMFGASGAIGFCAGLIFGGFVTDSLGWRYIFRIAVAVTGPLGIMGWILLPKDRKEGNARPKLDFVGAGLSTGGLILLSFVLSSGGEYGWNKAFIIALLIISVIMICVFAYVEKKVSNPIMPLSLWKIKNFAPLWIAGFVLYGSYQTVIYYVVLQAQEVAKLSAGATALRFLPMGAAGFTTNMVLAKWMKYMNTRYLMLLGMLITTLSPIPASLMPAEDPNFWRYILPTSVMVVTGVSICYICITNIMLGSVPANVKSLCGGLVNTAFQIGSGVSLALAAAVVDAVDIKKGHDEATQYQTGLYCCIGLSGLGLIVSAFGLRGLDGNAGSALLNDRNTWKMKHPETIQSSVLHFPQNNAQSRPEYPIMLVPQRSENGFEESPVHTDFATRTVLKMRGQTSQILEEAIALSALIRLVVRLKVSIVVKEIQ